MNRTTQEPTSRPTTPKKAPLLTALFVPVRGPSSPIGPKNAVPSRVPTVIAQNAAHQPRPKRIGSAPRTIVPKHMLAPNQTAATSRGLLCRSSGGTKSTPRVSMRPISSIGCTVVPVLGGVIGVSTPQQAGPEVWLGPQGHEQGQCRAQGAGGDSGGKATVAGAARVRCGQVLGGAGRGVAPPVGGP